MKIREYTRNNRWPLEKNGRGLRRVYEIRWTVTHGCIRKEKCERLSSEGVEIEYGN